MTNFLWKVIQLTIIIAVTCWVIYMDFNRNGLVTGLFAAGIAWVLTVLPLWLFGRIRRKLRADKGRVLARNETTQEDVDLLGP